MAHREKVAKEILSMLQLGITQKSRSNFTNLMVITVKKDGYIGLCLDTRKLYELLKRSKNNEKDSQLGNPKLVNPTEHFPPNEKYFPYL